MSAVHEHEFEAAPGLPEPLPAGERVLWQGAPQWRTLAVEVFHVRAVAIYLVAMLALQASAGVTSSVTAYWQGLAVSAVLALVAWGVLCWWAWLSARTTLYTLTNKRVVMRIGIVLTLTLNLPLRRLAGAAIKQGRHGVGDVSVTLVEGDRMGWAHLWPHARPWHVKQPQPSLRGVADVQRVAQLLQQAWRAANPDVAVTVTAQGEGAMAERHQPSVVMS